VSCGATGLTAGRRNFSSAARLFYSHGGIDARELAVPWAELERQAIENGGVVMGEAEFLSEMVRSLVGNPEYVQALKQQIEARTVDPKVVQGLVAYARSRQVTAGHAMVRKVLTEAGVSWEAV
jgi:hypothetical protein